MKAQAEQVKVGGYTHRAFARLWADVYPQLWILYERVYLPVYQNDAAEAEDAYRTRIESNQYLLQNVEERVQELGRVSTQKGGV